MSERQRPAWAVRWMGWSVQGVPERWVRTLEFYPVTWEGVSSLLWCLCCQWIAGNEGGSGGGNCVHPDEKMQEFGPVAAGEWRGEGF